MPCFVEVPFRIGHGTVVIDQNHRPVQVPNVSLRVRHKFKLPAGFVGLKSVNYLAFSGLPVGRGIAVGIFEPTSLDQVIENSMY